jgi:hypothetical protein
VKNKSDNIGNTSTKDLLNQMTNTCIPSVGEVEDDDVNQISVSIQINVGSDILEPCAFLHESNQTRNSIYVLH